MNDEQKRRRQQLALEIEAARKGGDHGAALAKTYEAHLIWRRAEGTDPWADRMTKAV